MLTKAARFLATTSRLLPRSSGSASSINRSLFFFLNCMGTSAAAYLIGSAAGGNGRQSCVAGYTIPHQEGALGNSESFVVFPYMEDGSAGGGDHSYRVLLRHGFLLSREAINGSVYTESGGRCLYNLR